jgi:hypothetical protein
MVNESPVVAGDGLVAEVVVVGEFSAALVDVVDVSCCEVDVSCCEVDVSCCEVDVLDDSDGLVVLGEPTVSVVVDCRCRPGAVPAFSRPLLEACLPATTLGVSSSSTNVVETQSDAAVATPASRRITSRRVTCTVPSRRSVDI